MQRSFCPECRAPIGGSSHRLERTNTVATDYTELAMGQGAQRTIWTNPTGVLN